MKKTITITPRQQKTYTEANVSDWFVLQCASRICEIERMAQGPKNVWHVAYTSIRLTIPMYCVSILIWSPDLAETIEEVRGDVVYDFIVRLEPFEIDDLTRRWSMHHPLLA